MTRFFLLASMSAAAVSAQELELPKNNHYEVVSIRAGVPGTACGSHFSPLEFVADNCSLQWLIGTLYNTRRGVAPVGLPKWASSETFTFRAKSIAPANPLEQWAMLRPVLEDRFKLKYHREKKQMPVYLLAVATGGVQFPATMPGSCTPVNPNVGPPPAGPRKPGEPEPPAPCARWLNQILPGGGVKLSAKGVTMAQLAGALEMFLDRPVVERSGSGKLFDVDLSFVKNEVTSDTNTESTGLPTVFAALKKAGLSLTRGQGAVDVLVIDQLERPMEN